MASYLGIKNNSFQTFVFSGNGTIYDDYQIKIWWELLHHLLSNTNFYEMAKKKKPYEPGEPPEPQKNPEIEPTTIPETPSMPDEEPGDIPDEEPETPAPPEITPTKD